MKRPIYLEAYEIETVAGALEKHADKDFIDGGYPLQVGKRELKRIAKKFRDALAPKPVSA
jgi:hypothetical protein